MSEAGTLPAFLQVPVNSLQNGFEFQGICGTIPQETTAQMCALIDRSSLGRRGTSRGKEHPTYYREQYEQLFERAEADRTLHLREL